MRPQATMAILTILVLGYAGRTWARNIVWTDDLSLFQATVEASPASAKAHHNLATAYFRVGRFDDAMAHYRRALAIYPAYTEAAFGVARIYDLRGADAGALYWYEKALRMDWSDVDAHLNTAIVRLRLGEVMSAEASLLTGLQIDSQHRGLLSNLAIVRYMQGRPWAAERLLEKVGKIGTNDTRTIAVASLQSPKAMEQR
jgi:Flp pilus assembly protein TadD